MLIFHQQLFNQQSQLIQDKSIFTISVLVILIDMVKMQLLPKLYQKEVLDKINDDFDSKKYEETIKKNFANKITNDLILKISQIQ